ncbi:MAG: hypothetical protein JXR63_03450 [Spirochaetales bacterium]|nr:hypothetical protein [Spirochaetales bacterium]
MKLKYLTIAILLFVSSNLLAAPQVTIRLYDKQIYTLSSKIFIHVTISNNSESSIKFSLADNRIHNLRFLVKTPQNLNVLPSNYSIKHLNSAQPVYYKEISLSPNEEFSFVTELNNFIDFYIPQKYFIKAIFYPEFNNTEKKIESNEIDIVITALERPTLNKFEEDTSSKYLIRSISNPEDVVNFMIKARQDAAAIPLISESKLPPDEIKNMQLHYWNKFFLYLDIESLYLKNTKRKSVYLKLSEKDRMLRLEEYKKRLIESDEDREIVLIPSNHTILKTVIANTNASVRVVQTYTYPTFVEKKVFTYYLKKDGNSWLIYNYEVSPYVEGM